MNFWGQAGDWVLFLHFGSCFGCVESVLTERSVSCQGGSGEFNGGNIFRVLGFLWGLWAC